MTLQRRAVAAVEDELVAGTWGCRPTQGFSFSFGMRPPAADLAGIVPAPDPLFLALPPRCSTGRRAASALGRCWKTTAAAGAKPAHRTPAAWSCTTCVATGGAATWGGSTSPTGCSTWWTCSRDGGARGATTPTAGEGGVRGQPSRRASRPQTRPLHSNHHPQPCPCASTPRVHPHHTHPLPGSTHPHGPPISLTKGPAVGAPGHPLPQAASLRWCPCKKRPAGM